MKEEEKAKEIDKKIRYHRRWLNYYKDKKSKKQEEDNRIGFKIKGK